MQVLVLTADPLLVITSTDVLTELGIRAESSEDSRQVSERLNQAKYEGVILDFDTVANAHPVLASVRESRSNKNAVVFAIATNHERMEQVLLDRAHFLIQRPVERSALSRTLRGAYDLMVGEHRRHFRVTSNLRALLARLSSGVKLECSTINISSNGMAVTAPAIFKPAEVVDIALLLPDGFEVRATGIVVWDDKHGKSGLHFQCTGPEMRQRLDSWLDSHFSKQKVL